MIFKTFTIIFFFFLNLSTVEATNILTIDLDKIINSNKDFIIFLNDINNLSINKKKLFLQNEKNLMNLKIKIEKNSLIYSDSEMKNKIDSYNVLLNEYQILLNNHNDKINKTIEINKNIILNQILIILKKYMTDNNIDLIIDKNNFLIANNSIDLSEYVIDKLINTSFNFNIN